MPRCHVCGQDNPEAARFCFACGAALVPAEERREERKVVTVLFADLVGFTSRAERLDPEDVRAVLRPYWEHLRAELERHGGTVEKFIGDAVMALFGAPLAHEDDPERAVRAAIAIRDWAREEPDVQVRIAVNTGEALVMLGARPDVGEGMAAGDVVNTTARLQAAAPINGVLVGETTYRATREAIEYAPREPVTAKGKAVAVSVWEAVQPRSRLGVDVDQRAILPLVGRVRELRVMVDAFERACAEREPQLVTLVGVPGIGKSRLVAELFAHVESRPELVWWRQGRALPYGEGVSFWAVAEMVKAQAGIQENDAPEVAVQKLRASVDAVVDEEERDWTAEHLLPLVGGRPYSGAGESLPAWRRYFERLAELRPLVLVFEDMHWADDGLLDFIDHLLDWAGGVRLLVVATARPELLERRPSWGGGKLNVSTVALTPLSDEEAAQILHGVLERAALPAETQQALLERAGGNPLYAEQFARLYVERGSAEELPLPETVQGLIAARLDVLSREEKRLLQDASVLGKVFWSGAVAELSGLDTTAVEHALHALERKGILRRDRRSAVGGETQYAFRHVLVRDVAYGQIPRAARGEKHVQATNWIERLGRAEDHAEVVGYHLASALEQAPDDAALRERARLALRRAGERAYALAAFPSAERFFAQALALWPREDGDYAPLLAAHARARFRVASDVETLVAALDALELAGLREDAAGLAAFAANALWRRGDVRRAREVIERAGSLLVGLPASPALAAVLAENARLAIFRGDYARYAADVEAALELTTRFGLRELRADLLVTSGAEKVGDGDLDEARAAFEAAVELAPPGSPALFRALANLALTEMMEGDYDAWRERHAAAVAAATRAGDRPHLDWVEVGAVVQARDHGRWDEALRRIDALLGRGKGYQDEDLLGVKAMILASCGHAEPARKSRDDALTVLEQDPDSQYAIPIRLDAAWVSFLLGEDERAQSLAATAAALIPQTRSRVPGGSMIRLLALLRTGHAEAAAAFYAGTRPTRRVVAAQLLLAGRVLEAADAWARVSPLDEALARIEAARQLVESGRRTQADVQLERGLAFFRAVGATRVVREAEALLAQPA